VIIYFDEGEQAHADALPGRYLPYADVEHDPDGAYYDFRAQPELIDQVLEDFSPFGDRAAVQRFYNLLRWINGTESPFESTDCLLRPPGQNETPHLGGGAALQIIGRLMIVHRDKELNTYPARMMALGTQFAAAVARIDPHWEMGAIGYCFYPTYFTALGPLSDVTTGHQLSMSFWGWGSTDDEAFANLGQLFGNLQAALTELAARPAG
jgi:hypothetical protein